MQNVKFKLIAMVSFLTTVATSIFINSTFLNRTLAFLSCTILGFNSAFCMAYIQEVKFERVMAADFPSVGEITKCPEDKLNSKSFKNLEQINKKLDLRLAFKASEKGHLSITRDALNTINVGELRFCDQAIRQIIDDNRNTDILPEVKDPESVSEYLTTRDSKFFSEDFFKPENHFDNEQFEASSQRLIDLKEEIIRYLTPNPNVSPYDPSLPSRGGMARARLGSALHTVQDFYAHTNWVELGFTEIDKRLGRQVITDPNRFSTLRPAPEDDPGKLLPKFIGTRDITKLTSGYFIGIGLRISCQAPSYKVRHGSINCRGLNKDEPDKDGFAKDGYKKARNLAVEASKDYINQIIENLPNEYSIKALMGMLDENIPSKSKENPCKSKPDNQKQKKCELKEGKSYGDPHLITFDGLKYSFQTVGEFILVKSNDDDLEVQVRQTPVNSSLSLNSAVAMKVGKDRVALYSQDLPDADSNTPLRINGKPVSIKDDFLSLSDGGKIAKNVNSYIVDFPSGEKLVATLAQVGGNYYFNVSPFVYNQPKRISGLLGDFNGKPDDDQKIRGGSTLASKSTYGDLKKVLDLVGIGQLPSSLKGSEELYFEQLYKDFSNSWRVKPQESLFDYPTGKTTANYTDTSFPDKYLKLEMLSSDQIEKARNACMEAKVSQDLMEGCIFDVGFSGFSEFARTTAEINGYINTVKKLFPGVNIPTVTNLVDQVVPKKICTFGICIERPF
ncbi:VWD domain-containing protein (plasmid) [Nostoc sp. UHCC 0302]|uniref:VWD domain-containing protein n=1 Tax=Nostoc sp. UHCC 0302 TaxID=3134896 RepID=UPI00311C8D69